MDFERKFKFFETFKNSPLCIFDLEYGDHRSRNTEFQSVFATHWRFTVKS
jgi:hypothetical protein